MIFFAVFVLNTSWQDIYRLYFRSDRMCPRFFAYDTQHVCDNKLLPYHLHMTFFYFSIKRYVSTHQNMAGFEKFSSYILSS